MIHKAKPGDLDGIMAVIRDIIAYPDKDLINQWDIGYPTKEIFAQDIRDGHLYVYSAQGTSIGGVFALMEDMAYQDNAQWVYPGAFLVIHRFCVMPALHGQGVAKAMLTWIDAHAAQNGYAALRLDTYSKNSRSNRLYAAAGYQFAGVIGGRKGIYHCYEKAVARI